MLGTKGWAAVMAAVVLVTTLVPILNLMVPADSVFHLSDYAVGLTAKIMCYAICALAMDLIWGYTGILSLGHGLFFALGGYAMGMYLMRQIGRDGSYGADIPDFMVFWTGKLCPGTGPCRSPSSVRCCWWCWCRACWPSCLASSPSAPESRGLFLHHHPGDDLCGHAAVFPQ